MNAITIRNRAVDGVISRIVNTYDDARSVAEARGASPADVSRIGLGVMGLEAMIDILSIIEGDQDITFGRMAVMLGAMVSEVRTRALIVSGEDGLAGMDGLLKSSVGAALLEPLQPPRKSN